MARRTASSGSDGSSSEEFAFRPKQAEHEQRTRDGAVHDGKVAMWVAMGASVLGLLCSAYGIFSFRLDDSFFCGAFVITAVGWGILIGVELFMLRELHEKRRGHHGAIIRRSAFIFGGWCFGYFAAALVVVVVCMVKGRFAHSDSPGVGYTLLFTEAILDLVICGACLARYVHRYLTPIRHAQPHLENKADMMSTETQIAHKVSRAGHHIARKVSSASSTLRRKGSDRSTRASRGSRRRTPAAQPSPKKKEEDYGSASSGESSASHGSASGQSSSDRELLPRQRKKTSTAPPYYTSSSASPRHPSQTASNAYPPGPPTRSNSLQSISTPPPPPYRSPSLQSPANTPSAESHTVLVKHQTPAGTQVRRWNVDKQRYEPAALDARQKYLQSVSSLPESLRPGYSSITAPPTRSTPATVRATGPPTFPPLPPAPPHPYGAAWRQPPPPLSRSGAARPSSTATRAPYAPPAPGQSSSATPHPAHRSTAAPPGSYLPSPQRPDSLPPPPSPPRSEYQAWRPAYASLGAGYSPNPDDKLPPMPLCHPPQSR